MIYELFVDGELLYTPSMERFLISDICLEQVTNASGQLDFQINVEHPMFHNIHEVTSVIEVYRDGEWLWSGIPIMTEAEGATCNYTSYGVLYALNFSVQSPVEYKNKTAKQFLEALIAVHNQQTPNGIQFVVGDVDVEAVEESTATHTTIKYGSKGSEVQKMQRMLIKLGYSCGSYGADGIWGSKTDSAVKKYQRAKGIKVQSVCDASMWSLLEADYSALAGHTNNFMTEWDNTLTTISEQLVKVYGGYIRLERINRKTYRINYTVASGKSSSQRVRAGDNLVELIRRSDFTEICTAVLPLGDPIDTDSELDLRTTIGSVNGGSNIIYDDEYIAEYGTIIRVVEFKDVTKASDLLRKARDWLANYRYDKMIIEGSVVDLHLSDDAVESFCIGDYVDVEIILPRAEGEETFETLVKTYPISRMVCYPQTPEEDIYRFGVIDDEGIESTTSANIGSY